MIDTHGYDFHFAQGSKVTMLARLGYMRAMQGLQGEISAW